MSRIRAFAFLGLLACTTTSTAFAQIVDPDPGHSVVQSPYLSVEGFTANAPAPYNAECASSRCPDPCNDGRCARFLVIVRDFANNPVASARVWIDFSQCSDIAIACDQLTAETGQTYVSPSTVEGHADANGRFNFRVQGRAITSLPTGPETAPGTNVNAPCAMIWAELAPGAGGTLLSMEKVSAYDVTGALGDGTVNTTDASFVMAERLKVALGAQARARDDYDYNGAMNINDVAIAIRMALDAGLGSGSRTTGQACP